MQEPTEEPRPPVPAPEKTGHSRVDQVLSSLDSLDDRPVAEHVEVFDAAHEELRRALSDAGQPRPPASS